MTGSGTSAAPVGVLLMAHGTPARPGELEAFYTRIRRGRPPSPEQLADLRRRYDAIGGVSPLADRTRAQVEGIARRLEDTEPGRFVVRYGAKHTEPGIEEAAQALAGSGVTEVVGVVLTPHRSSMGSGEYLARAATVLGGAGTPFVPVRQWYDAPGFAELLGDRLVGALESPALTGGRPLVLFTAHSLPVRVVEEGDPYPQQLTESAELVAAAAGLQAAGVPWRVAWQSAGRTPEPWLGPDVLEVIRTLPGDGYTAVVACPIGFVADHLEVLYDLDVEADQVAKASGIAFVRTASLNDDPRFSAVLAEVVRRAARSTRTPAGQRVAP